jgi:hypothetical protein
MLYVAGVKVNCDAYEVMVNAVAKVSGFVHLGAVPGHNGQRFRTPTPPAIP